MTEPLWVDPTPLVRWVMPHCRVAQQTGDITRHNECRGHTERTDVNGVIVRAETCRCPCHRRSAS